MEKFLLELQTTQPWLWHWIQLTQNYYYYCCNLINCSHGSRSARVDLKFTLIFSLLPSQTPNHTTMTCLNSLIANIILNAISFFLDDDVFSVTCYRNCLISLFLTVCPGDITGNILTPS